MNKTFQIMVSVLMHIIHSSVFFLVLYNCNRKRLCKNVMLQNAERGDAFLRLLFVHSSNTRHQHLLICYY